MDQLECFKSFLTDFRFFLNLLLILRSHTLHTAVSCLSTWCLGAGNLGSSQKDLSYQPRWNFLSHIKVCNLLTVSVV
jgi:hypothetical protein